MPDTFYITTPIYYVNDVPHIGHAYTTVAADATARYMRLIGREVFFLTGTDEHGQKVEKTALSKGMTNKEFVDSVAPRYMELWKTLGISNDDFIRTTEARHVKAVQSLFSLLLEKGDIYKGEYEDWYCVPCESFWTTLQLKEGGRCPDCGRPVDKIKEESYFFRMSAYEQALLDHIEKNPGFIMPESRKNEIVSFVKSGLRDLSISRTSFTWGIPVPGDERHVIYVWLDALTNYISALGYPDTSGRYRKFWPSDVHVIGKDILRFHAVYWPTFLLAAGLPLPKRIFSHGWWTISGEKMSKSRGNVVDPFEVVREMDELGLGVDAFRYFLLREVPFGLDGDFSKDAMSVRINSDLANDLGNLHFRTLNMIEKYLGGFVPAYERPGSGEEAEVFACLEGLFMKYSEKMEAQSFSEALQAVWQAVSMANKMIDHAAPWELAKGETPEDKKRLLTVLGVASGVVRAACILLYPVMPEKMQMVWEQSGENVLLSKVKLKADGTLVVQTDEVEEDTKTVFFIPPKVNRVRRGPAPFPRIETDAVKAKKAASEAGGNIKAASKAEKQALPGRPAAAPPDSNEKIAASPEAGGLIKIDDFMKVDLRTGRVLAAERVPKSDKLIKMSVDIGTETRQIVGGIGKSYSPEELVGRTVVVVANLKPAKLMGVESQGMLLAAGDVDSLRLAGFDAEVKTGTKVK